MITFEEFADAYAAAVPKILAKMKYLKERRKQNRSNKMPF